MDVVAHFNRCGLVLFPDTSPKPLHVFNHSVSSHLEYHRYALQSSFHIGLDTLGHDNAGRNVFKTPLLKTSQLHHPKSGTIGIGL